MTRDSLEKYLDSEVFFAKKINERGVKMIKYESVCNFDVLDEVVNGERILLIDRATESINSLDEISIRDLAIAIKAENKDNRYEFYKEVKVNESLSV